MAAFAVGFAGLQGLLNGGEWDGCQKEEGIYSWRQTNNTTSQCVYVCDV